MVITGKKLRKTKQGKKTGQENNPGLITQGQANFALGQMKIDVWWSSGQVKEASVVFLV